MKAKFAMLIRDYFGANIKRYDSAARKSTRGHSLNYEDDYAQQENI